MGTRSNKTSADSGDIIQSGKWNASRDYTIEMVFKPLYYCYVYERIAKFGTHELIEDIVTSEGVKKRARIDALKRLLFELQEIINNTEFSLKTKRKKKRNGEERPSDKDNALWFLDRLEFIEKNLLNFIEKKKQWGDRYDIDIDENKFHTLLKELQKIRRKLTEYADNAELIYFQKEAELTKEEMDELIWNEMTEK